MNDIEDVRRASLKPDVPSTTTHDAQDSEVINADVAIAIRNT